MNINKTTPIKTQHPTINQKPTLNQQKYQNCSLNSFEYTEKQEYAEYEFRKQKT